ncbi:MAG: hypothetical protein M1823_003147 [Watsoniomyces obsoletus]|nr:MAG: hypothetical protein M1823_003147 [Watsoniomyces obsoletus]
MVARAPLALVSLILTAGACLLLFLVVLGGTRDRTPLDDIYFLRAETSGIGGAPREARWTLWNACETENGRNVCPSVRAAYPLDPPRNFGSDDDIPADFIGTKKYYYLTRFMFAFILIALFFAVLSLFTGLLALCSRLGGALSGLLAAVALFFQTVTAALMTAAYVMGRNAFRDGDREAYLGTKAFAFVWAAMACLLLATILFFSILATGRDTTTRSSSSRGRFAFGRKRSARDRGSFIESESQRRVVKDEYS